MLTLDYSQKCNIPSNLVRVEYCNILTHAGTRKLFHCVLQPVTILAAC